MSTIRPPILKSLFPCFSNYMRSTRSNFSLLLRLSFGQKKGIFSSTACRCRHIFSDKNCVVCHILDMISWSPPLLPHSSPCYIHTPWCTIWSDRKRRQCLSFLLMFGLCLRYCPEQTKVFVQVWGWPRFINLYCTFKFDSDIFYVIPK
jgi:hypothetical protein